MFPPAEAPPTMRPREGEALRVGAWEMAQVRASQQSFMPVGNLCSGARLGLFVSGLDGDGELRGDAPVFYVYAYAA